MKEEFYPGENNEAFKKQSVGGKTLEEKAKAYEEKVEMEEKDREESNGFKGFEAMKKRLQELADRSKIDAIRAELGIKNSGQDKETQNEGAQNDDLYKMNLSDIDKMDLKDIDKMLKKDSNTELNTIRAESGVKGSEQNKEIQDKEAREEGSQVDDINEIIKKIRDQKKLRENNNYRNNPYIKKDYDRPKKGAEGSRFRG